MTELPWDRILTFIEAFESPGFSPGYWYGANPLWQRFDYSPSVCSFVETFYEDGWVVYFDKTKWVSRARSFYDNPEQLKRAKLLTLRKLLTFHIRKDRFTEGHLALMLEKGHILAILRRLSDLSPITKPTGRHPRPQS